MANTRAGNSWYIDSTGDLGTDTSNTQKRVVYITLTATAANAILALRDRDSDQNKIELRIATSGDTKMFPFEEAPISFPGGIKVQTITNGNATIVFRETGA